MTAEANGGSTWQESAEARAPLVASVLEQFGRMTALAKETTSNLLTSNWGVQPGEKPVRYVAQLIIGLLF